MAEAYFGLSLQDQRDALEAASAASGRPLHLLEKDVWVVGPLLNCSAPLSGSISYSRAEHHCRRPIRSSGVFPRMSI